MIQSTNFQTTHERDKRKEYTLDSLRLKVLLFNAHKVSKSLENRNIDWTFFQQKSMQNVDLLFIHLHQRHDDEAIQIFWNGIVK